MKKLVLLLIISLMLHSAANAQTLVNGSFEADTVADGDYLGSGPSGWNAHIGGSPDVWNPTGDGKSSIGSAVPNGNNVLKLGGGAALDEVWQYIPVPGGLKNGQVYTFSVKHAGLISEAGPWKFRVSIYWSDPPDYWIGDVRNEVTRSAGDRDWAEYSTYLYVQAEGAAGYPGITVGLVGYSDGSDKSFFDNATVTVSEPNMGSFVPTAKTLAPAERQELYLQLIEDFISWAESSRWVNDNTLETGGGYYNASGSGVTWERGNSNLCWALSVLLTGRPTQNTFTRFNITRATLEDHLEKTIRSLCLSNKNYSGKTTSWWGGPAWQASLGCIGTAWAAHLQEAILQADTITMWEEVLGDEAEALKKTIPYYTSGDTKAEDGNWNAPVLAFAANKLSSDPRASSWDEWARKWAINSVSMPGDSTDDTTIVDGHPLSYWVSGWNIFADYTLENHGFIHPGYNLEYGRMSAGEMAYKTFGNPIPEAFSFRHQQMWDNLGKILLLADGDSAYPHGNDWAYKDINHIYYSNWHATARGQSEASAFESRGVQFLRKRQLNRGNGSVCDYDFGYHCDLVGDWALCWQTHNYWTSDTMPYDVAEPDSYCVHRYPHAKASIHRNKRKIVSVSWHPYGQGIHIMPQEGIDTFPEPPFYFPWARDSGVIGHVSSPSLENFETTHNGQGMRVTVKRPMNSNIDQYITVVSLPDEATVYSTIFYAKNSTSYSVGQLFPLQARWLSESPGSVTQRRGTNWLNMSDYVGFVSPKPLPEKIATDKFFLTEKKKFNVKTGQWFSPAAVVVYVRQTHEQTKQLAEKIDLWEDLKRKELRLRMYSSSGQAQINLWTHP